MGYILAGVNGVVPLKLLGFCVFKGTLEAHLEKYVFKALKNLILSQISMNVEFQLFILKSFQFCLTHSEQIPQSIYSYEENTYFIIKLATQIS